MIHGGTDVRTTLKRRNVLLAAGVALLEMGLVPVFGGRRAAAQFCGSAYEGAIYDACARHGCDGTQLNRVHCCETAGTGSHDSVGPNGERGVFQFHPQGEWPYAAWYGPYEQIELAAHLWATGHGGAWVCQ